MELWSCSWCFGPHVLSPPTGYYLEPTGVVDLPNDRMTQVKFNKCRWLDDCIDLYSIEFFYQEDKVEVMPYDCSILHDSEEVIEFAVTEKIVAVKVEIEELRERRASQFQFLIYST